MTNRDIEVILINANLLTSEHKLPFKVVRRFDNLKKQWSSILEKIAEIGKLGKEKEASEEEISKEIEDYLEETANVNETIPLDFFDEIPDTMIHYGNKGEGDKQEKLWASSHAIIRLFQDKGFAV